jgi:cytidyltransferase-like protein
MKNIIISGSFDDIRSADIGFFKAAAEKGRVSLVLWSDAMHQKTFNTTPKFSLKERLYFTESIKYIDRVIVEKNIFEPDSLPASAIEADLWIVKEANYNTIKRDFCSANNMLCETAVMSESETVNAISPKSEPGRKKIIVTGCYDFFHTGHIRFFEEVSEHGDLYVVIGSDKNVALLKGKGHPHYSEDERLSIVRSIKYVNAAYVSTGSGWMDAEPEINLLKPDIYAVNEDGNKPEKREFCEEHDLQYLILKRMPKEGLPTRTSTDLRGF